MYSGRWDGRPGLPLPLAAAKEKFKGRPGVQLNRHSRGYRVQVESEQFEENQGGGPPAGFAAASGGGKPGWQQVLRESAGGPTTRAAPFVISAKSPVPLADSSASPLRMPSATKWGCIPPRRASRHWTQSRKQGCGRGIFPLSPESSRCVCALTSEGTRAARPWSVNRAPEGASFRMPGKLPAAIIRPPRVNTAPFCKGGAQTGTTHSAR